MATRGRKPKPTALKLLEGKKQAGDFLIIADQTTVFLLILVFDSTILAGAAVRRTQVPEFLCHTFYPGAIMRKLKFNLD